MQHLFRMSARFQGDCMQTLSKLSAMGSLVLLRDAFCAEDLQLGIVATRDGSGYFLHLDLVHLLAVDDQPWYSVQPLVAYLAFEMLGFLVADEDLLVVKVPVAVPAATSKRKPRMLPSYWHKPAPRLLLLLLFLFLSHGDACDKQRLRARRSCKLTRIQEQICAFSRSELKSA